MKIHAEVPSEFNPTEDEYPDEVVVHLGEEKKVTRINADGFYDWEMNFYLLAHIYLQLQ